jgi:hypothetical protein
MLMSNCCYRVNKKVVEQFFNNPALKNSYKVLEPEIIKGMMAKYGEKEIKRKQIRMVL